MQGVLYAQEPHALWIFLGLTVILGGGLAMATGRGIAQTWRPYAMVAIYMAPLALAVRFLHFALFEERLLSVQYFAVAYAVVLGAATIGFLSMRAEQMSRQYPWLHERANYLAWRARGDAAPHA